MYVCLSYKETEKSNFKSLRVAYKAGKGKILKWGVVAHTYNLRTLVAKVGGLRA